jgi:hypothetical protein
MEAPDTLSNSLPYAFLATIPAAALLFLLLKKHRQSHPKTRNCPHCLSEVGSNEVECGNCHRKILFAKHI